jgi:aconitase A
MKKLIKITIEKLENIKPGEPINLTITKEDGSTFDIVTLHSLSDEQIKWFFSGSALNYIKEN